MLPFALLICALGWIFLIEGDWGPAILLFIACGILVA